MAGLMQKADLYLQLRDDIRRRHWPEGRVLKQQELADYYQTSRIPVREALARLAAEGWLVSAGKASLMVPALSAEEALELCLIRSQLEPLALRQALPQLNQAILGAAADCLVAAESAVDDPLRHGELNWQFHLLLYQPCGMPTLLQLLQQLHLKVAMYLGFQQVKLGYADKSAAEHRELLQLLREGRHEAALDLLQQHISDAANALQLHLQQNKG
jgi:DNA-binding GntR family transcriptional regulator